MSSEGPVIVDETLANAIRNKIESLLSKDNLKTDTYITSLLNPQLYVSLSGLVKIAEVEKLTNDVAVLRECLTKSTELTLNAEGTMVKPNIKAERNTIFIRQVPNDKTESDIQNLFDNPDCGTIVKVWSDVGSSWFVSFEDEEHAIKALNHLSTKTFSGDTIKARLKSENVLHSIAPVSTSTNPTVMQAPSFPAGMIVNGGFPNVPNFTNPYNTAIFNQGGFFNASSATPYNSYGGGGYGMDQNIDPNYSSSFRRNNNRNYNRPPIVSNTINTNIHNTTTAATTITATTTTTTPSTESVSSASVTVSLPLPSTTENVQNISPKGNNNNKKFSSSSPVVPSSSVMNNNNHNNSNINNNNNNNNSGSNNNNLGRKDNKKRDGGAPVSAPVAPSTTTTTSTTAKKVSTVEDEKNINKKGLPKKASTHSVPLFANNELFPPLPGAGVKTTKSGYETEFIRYENHDILYIAKTQKDLSKPASLTSDPSFTSAINDKANTTLATSGRTLSMDQAIAHGRPVRSLSVDSVDFESMVLGGTTYYSEGTSPKLSANLKGSLDASNKESSFELNQSTSNTSNSVASESKVPITPVNKESTSDTKSTTELTTESPPTKTANKWGGYAAALLKPAAPIVAPTPPVVVAKPKVTSTENSSSKDGGRKDNSSNSKEGRRRRDRDGGRERDRERDRDSGRGKGREEKSSSSSTPAPTNMNNTNEMRAAAARGGRGWEKPRPEGELAPVVENGKTDTSIAVLENNNNEPSNESTSNVVLESVNNNNSNNNDSIENINNTTDDSSSTSTTTSSTNTSTSTSSSSAPAPAWGGKKSFVEIVGLKEPVISAPIIKKKPVVIDEKKKSDEKKRGNNSSRGDRRGGDRSRNESNNRVSEKVEEHVSVTEEVVVAKEEIVIKEEISIVEEVNATANTNTVKMDMDWGDI